MCTRDDNCDDKAIARTKTVINASLLIIIRRVLLISSSRFVKD